MKFYIADRLRFQEIYLMQKFITYKKQKLGTEIKNHCIYAGYIY